MSRHRTRPPTFGIHRRTRVNVVDNSEIGRAALMSGRPAYCFQVLKHGYRKDHMPKAELGDLMYVAVQGEVFKAIVVGCKNHPTRVRPGVPNYDTNNVVLLTRDGHLVGTRILAPVPSALRALRDRPHMTKLLSIATKFI